jgi:hypothetical protein
MSGDEKIVFKLKIMTLLIQYSILQETKCHLASYVVIKTISSPKKFNLNLQD